MLFHVVFLDDLLNQKTQAHMCRSPAYLPSQKLKHLSACSLTSLRGFDQCTMVQILFQPRSPFTRKVSQPKSKKNNNNKTLHQSPVAGMHLYDIWSESDPECIQPGLTFKAGAER